MSTFKTTLRTGIAVLALTFAGGAIGNTATAQAQTATKQMPVQQQAAKADISDAQLEKFAVANQKVVELQKDYHDLAAKAENKQDLQALVDATNDDIKQAISESGLTLDEFNGIATALQNDAQLREKFMNMVNAG